MMSAVTGQINHRGGVAALIQRHPLIAYFTLAFAGMWIVISPMVLASLGIIPLSEELTMLVYILATYSGPTLAALIVTGVVDGRAGVKQLIRRTFQVRAGVQWYLVALFGFLVIWLAGYSAVYSGEPLINLSANWSLLYTFFLPSVVLGLIIPSIGEEPGWRGFALPRLQALHGPIVGTLILGFLHGVWHLPALLTPFLGPVDLQGFIAFVLTAMGGTFLYTWLFNNTRGSVWMAMVMHASSNAATQLVTELIPADTVLAQPFQALLPWLNVIIFTTAALALVALTRGTLSYRPAAGSPPVEPVQESI